MEPLSMLSVFLGALSAFLLLSVRALPHRWARLLADAGREQGLPIWAWACIALSICGTILFWYLHFTGGEDLSLAMAILGTFLMARVSYSLLTKTALRQGVQLVLQRRTGPALLPYTVASLALLVLGLI